MQPTYYMYILYYFQGMGKRKLRFYQTKNYERKKYGLKVKIPLTLLPPADLVLHLPITAFLSSEAKNADVLFTRLSAVRALPTGWIIPEHSTRSPNTSFILCKLQQHPPALTPSFIFTIVFNAQCKWKLTVGSFEVTGNSSNLLSQVPPVLSNVKAVIELISLLDSSKLCEGNNDDKFIDLMHNKGTLKDQHGKLVHVLTVWMCRALLEHL